jgi:hypothetical protein
MTELKFRTDLYDPDAITDTIAAFEPYVKIERETAENEHTLRFSVDDESEEAELAGEIQNYVLGATVDRAKAAGE